MTVLPQGWVELKLEEMVQTPQQDLVDGPFGSNLKASEYTDDGFPVIRIQNVERNKFVSKNLRYVNEDKYFQLIRHSFSAGDIVITKLGDPLGRAAIVPSELSAGLIVADVVRLRLPSHLIDAKYICYAINSPNICAQLAILSKGSTRMRVNLSHIRSLRIPFAPYAEQIRIAEKLDNLLISHKFIIDKLNKIESDVTVLRQSALDSEQHGAKNSTKNFVSIEEVSLAIFDGPFGSNLKSTDYVEHGIQVVRLENIGHLHFKSEKKVYITEKKYIGLKRHTLQGGDILFSSFIDEQVRVVALPEVFDQVAINKADVFCIRVDSSVCRPRYLAYILASKKSCVKLKLMVHGATRPRINLKQLRSFLFDLPSIFEQDRFIAEMDKIYESTDTIRKKLKSVSDSLEKLVPVILNQAFLGRLTNREDSDDEVSDLLEKIRHLGGHQVVSQVALQIKSKSKMKTKKILSVLESLEMSPTPLSAQQLLHQSGYPVDSDADLIERFFLDLRSQLEAKNIVRYRNGVEDIFSLASRISV